MSLAEMEEHCKKVKITSEAEFWAVRPIYCLLDFHKDDFCKLLDAIGLEKWLEKAEHWKRLEKAEQLLTQKETYERSKWRLEEIAREQARLMEIVEQYEAANRL